MHKSVPDPAFPDVHLPVAGELAIGAATSTWIAHGFRVARSLSIAGACAPSSHSTCPHTGDSPCECLLAVLFVASDGGSPVTVLAHGHRNDTTFSLQQDESEPDALAPQKVWRVLGSAHDRS